MTTMHDRDVFMILLARAMPEASAETVRNFAKRIISAAGSHQRACECDCSFPTPPGIPDYWTARIALAEAGAERAIKAFQAPFRLVCQTDPRGCTMALAWTAPTEDFERLLYPPARGLPAKAFA